MFMLIGNISQLQFKNLSKPDLLQQVVTEASMAAWKIENEKQSLKNSHQ